MPINENISPIFTIGHGNRSLEDTISILNKFDINYLVDIRSRPYSKYNPELNKDTLDSLLRKSDIRYVFMGDLLGGLPGSSSCYTEGKVDYQKLSETTDFISGIIRLKAAYAKNLKIALMCSESKPQHCHRTKLIGVVLEKENIEVEHINEHGELITQDKALTLATGGQSEYDLFGNLDIKSKGTY